MATDKKHIAVYLDPAVEQALVAFCEQKGLKSKKGTMFSAGVNAALAEFFGLADAEDSNIPPGTDNIPAEVSNIPSHILSNIPAVSNIPSHILSNIPAEVSNIPSKNIAVEVLPGKFRA
jgi:hypothetical protein